MYNTKDKLCPDCHIIFTPRSRNQKRCGSLRDKIGCAYAHRLKTNGWRTYSSSEINKEAIGQARKEIKDKIFGHYGNLCSCCNESEPMLLTIDHINNDAIARHNAGEPRGGYHLYGWLIRNNFPDGFQVLCYNCNIGKYKNKGSCPHKTKST